MSKRVLFIDTTSNCLDLALRAKLAGWHVKWYDKPRAGGVPRLSGKGMIDKIDDFQDLKRKWLDWADLIYLPDNTQWLDMLEPYRLQGYPILAPSAEAAELELNRRVGQEAMAAHGIKIMESKAFFDYDDAIAYVKKHPHFLVSKPSGDAAKALSYVASDPADLVYMLTRWKSNPELKKAAKTDGFILQERKYGVEMAVGGWYGPGGWSKWFYENWEYKKLMDGDLGVACYSDDTEVLTDSGWKYWPDVCAKDKLATLVDGVMEFETPSHLVAKEVDEELLGWQSLTVDILVTAGHSMYVQDCHARKDFKFEPADITATKKRRVLRGVSSWNGKTKMDANFARLIGAYIADGNCKKNSLQFGNCPFHKVKKFTEFAEKAGYSAKKYGIDLYINSRSLSDYCKPFGKAHEKYVPDEIKYGSLEVINSFLEGYLAGDGSVSKNGSIGCETVSKQLADDLQEMFLRTGRTATINIRDRVPVHDIKGIRAKSYRRAYALSICSKNTKAVLSEENHYTTSYKGKVYCATVSTHILLVRRNGKPVWLGNTGEMGTLSRMTKNSKLAKQVLLPIAPLLDKLGYCGYIDNNCIIDDQGNPWPMEWTMRDGWPTKHNVTAHIKNEDPIQWMLDGMNGQDTIEAIEGEVCVSVVVALPDFPYSKITNKDLCGIPIRGAEDMEHIHLSEVMIADVPTMVGDKVVTLPGLATCGDYTLVVTGTGDSITTARRSAYRAVDKVKIPNNPFYRLDIGAGRMKKHLPTLHRLGYAKGLEF